MSRALCAVEACGRPAMAQLCVRCSDQLAAELRAIATGGTARVRTHHIGRRVPVPVVYPAPRWTRVIEVREVVERRPGLAAELETMVTRQHRHAPGAGHTADPDEGLPLPFNERASDLAADLRATLFRWTAVVLTHARHLRAPHPLTVPAAAGWLAGIPARLAVLPDAKQLHADVLDLTRRIRRAIDSPDSGVYLGQCGAPLDDDPDTACEADIYATPGARMAACPGCGAHWATADRREFLLNAVDDQLATATEISRALSGLGRPVTAAMIRGYAHRGHLAQYPPHPLDPRGHTRYRIGDVRDVLDTVKESG
ncbi:hypothetical protein L3Q67_01045 [Saccharothrix sp. AJ9571]|nr:hypothetical protein L3Q67_01045 [Saccharothrix sp. AJ9571]